MGAFLVSFRETLEYSVMLFLLISVFSEHKKALFTSSIFAAAAGFLITAFNYPLSGRMEDAYTGLLAYSFLAVLMLSLMQGRGAFRPVICIILAVLLPSAQLASVVIGEASLKGMAVYIASSTGIISAVIVFLLCLKLLPVLQLQRFFGTGGVMASLASFCFLFGGLREFDPVSPIISLHRGLHSSMISTAGLFDGAVNISFQSVLAYLSSERVVLAIAALLLFSPSVYLFIRLLLSPEPSIGGIEVKAEQRKTIASYTDELLRKGVPLLISLLVIIVLLHSANLAMSPKFDPEPIPLANDDERIAVPLNGKYGDIADGTIKKFSIRQGAKAYRFIIIARPDGSIAAALDACEICPDDGYVQRGAHLICKYCGTPISLPSLGQPGGCNPIPLEFQTDGDNIIISREVLISTHDKWIGGATEYLH